MTSAKKHFYLKWIIILGVCLLVVAGLLIVWNNFLYGGMDPDDYASDQQLIDLTNTEQELMQNSSTFRTQVSSTYPEKYQTNFGVLLYHRVTTNIKYIDSRWTITPKNFEDQVKFLQDNGYQFVKMAEAYQTYQQFALATSSSSSPYHKTVALTFDDGYRDFHTTVFPILQKYQIPATVFVITKDVGKNGNVTWEMLKEMTQSGLVEVGSHTISHKYSTRLSDDALWEEFAGSKAVIEEKASTTVNVLAYPYGVANQHTNEMAQKAGYMGAVRVMAGERPSADNLFSWRRVSIYKADVGPLLLKKIFTAFEIIK